MYQLQGDSYVWVPCRVVGWDASGRIFDVEFDPQPNNNRAIARHDSKGGFITQGVASAAGNIKSKQVKRLNLRFMAEDKQLFERRIAAAKAGRAEAEAQLRELFYLDAIDSGIQEVIATYDFHAALTAASLQVKGLSGPVLEVVGRILMEDLVDYYERAFKQCILNYRR